MTYMRCLVCGRAMGVTGGRGGTMSCPRCGGPLYPIIWETLTDCPVCGKPTLISPQERGWEKKAIKK